MREKHYPPKFYEQQFNCVYCAVYSKQFWQELNVKTAYGNQSTGMYACHCEHCSKWSYWYDAKMVIPLESSAEPPHPDLPEGCKRDYEEARAVFSLSPRASAALLRLTLQKLMVELGEKGKNLNEDIATLVAKGLPLLVQRALDYCRVVGNNAVHPGEIEIEDTPDIAENLFRMINFIVEDRITKPQEIEALYGKLPDGAREAIERRDAKK